MKTLIKTFILGMFLLIGFNAELALASVKPPLETQIELSTKALKAGVSTDVKLMVLVPGTGNSRVASIKLTLTGRGIVDILGSNEWVIDNFVIGEIQETFASFLLNGSGNGRLHLQAETFDKDGNRLWGRTDSLFFLVVKDQVLSGVSSGFELRREKLGSDLLKGLLNKSEYEQEIENLLGGKELRFERALRGLPEVEASISTDIEPIVGSATISGRATYTHRIDRKDKKNIFATEAKARGISGAEISFYHKYPGGATGRLDTTPTDVRTDANGYYSAVVPGTVKDGTETKATNLIVKITALNEAAIVGPVGIITSPWKVHWHQSSSKIIDENALSIDIVVDNSDPDVLGAFSLLDAAYVSFNYVKNTIARTGIGAAPQQIFIEFPGDKSNEAYFSKTGTERINMGQDTAFDWDVFTHEYGHYIQKLNGTNEGPGGDHNVENLTGYVQPSSGLLLTKDMAIKLAWGEGWPTYFGTSLQIDSGAGDSGIYAVGDTIYTDTADDFGYGVEWYRGTFRGLGEDDEISVQRILWDFADTLQDGHDTVTYGNDAMWKLLHDGVKPTTLDAFRAKVNDRTPGTGPWYYSSGTPELNRAKYGRIYFDHNVGPEPILPVEGFSSLTPPVFKWFTKGAGDSPSYNFDEFTVQFWDVDFTREYFTSLAIPAVEGKLSADGDTAEWQPSQADWDWINSRGGPLIHWAVAGSHSDGTTRTGPYLGLDRTIGAPHVAFVIDETGSMSEEIAGVKAALTRYVNWLRTSPPAVSPVVEIITFTDNVWLHGVYQDLDVVQTKINALTAGGGFDCPEASGQALTTAVNDLASGGVIVFVTDAPPHSGYSLRMAKSIARSKGIRINQIITGDCNPKVTLSAATSQVKSGQSVSVPYLKPVLSASHNPGYEPPPVQSEPVIWWHNVVCPQCPVGPGVGPPMTPNILKEIGDSSLPVESALDSYLDLATASPNGSFLFFPDVKDGDSEPFINAVANSAMAASRPTVMMVKPVQGYQGATMDIEILGGRTNFGANSQLTISGPGITINSVTPLNATSLMANITIGPAANPAARNIRVNTDLGGGQTESAGGFEQFRVIASVSEAKLVSITPATLELGGTYALTLNGINTNFSAGLTTVIAGSDITVKSVAVTGPGSLKAIVTIATDARLGFHSIEAVTGSESAWLYNTLAVVASIGLPPGMPGIISVAPDRAEQYSANLKVTIRGRDTHFVNGITSAYISGPGVTVLSTTVTSPTFAVLRINIDGNATLGYRDIALTTGGEMAAIIAAVLIKPASVSPPPPEPEPSQNPCNDVYVKQAPNELVIKVFPNGVDDTENIQCALDWAVDTGMPVVKLSADTFYISSLVIEKFNGSLQGVTTDSTLIEVLDHSVPCTAMANSGRVPAAIKFIKGEPRLRYMTIRAHRSCKTDSRFLAILSFTGEAAVPIACSNDVIFGSVDRVILDGTSKITGPLYGIIVGAESENFDVCQGRLLGTFKLNRSQLANTRFGITSSMKAGAQVDINFNDFIGHLSAIWMVDSNQNTTITANQFFGESTADDPHFSIVTASTADAPDATRVVVHNNDFNLYSPHGRNCIGVLTQQPGKIVNLSSIITKNRFVLRGNTTWAVYSTDVSNTHVSTNRFTGTAQGAILVTGTTPVKGWTITANTGFNNLVSSSLRDIWLRENTSRCIVGPGQGASIHDFGTGNSILTSFTPSPTVFQNKVNSGPPTDFVTDELNADISKYLHKIVEKKTADGLFVGGNRATNTDTSLITTQSTNVNDASLEEVPNPCNDVFVKQSSNELIIKVTPNGVDDTENVQCALNWAVDTGMPVVQLSADWFYISSLEVRKFNGSLQGVTTDSTTIQVLDKSISCVSMSSSGQSSAAIKFIKGEPRLRFMTIIANRACMNDFRLNAVVNFTGEPADTPVCANDIIFGIVDRVILDGTSTLTGPEIGVSATSESSYFPGGVCDRKLLGTFKLNRSTLANTRWGIATRLSSAAQVDINFNSFVGHQASIIMFDANQNTTITANEFYGDSTADQGYFGIRVLNSIYAPDSNRLVIHNNDFNLSSLFGLESSGVQVGRSTKVVNISSVITNNRFVLSGNSAWGVSYRNISNTHVSANRFMGAGAGAIAIGGNEPVTGWTITANTGFKDFVSSSFGDILLGGNTSRCIVGPGQGVTINDLGFNNSILTSFSPSPTAFQNKVESNSSPGFEMDMITTGFLKLQQEMLDRQGVQQ